MFADDASVLIPKRNFNKFMGTFNMVISHIAKWFHAKWLILNVDEMNIMKFTPFNQSCNPLTTLQINS